MNSRQFDTVRMQEYSHEPALKPKKMDWNYKDWHKGSMTEEEYYSDISRKQEQVTKAKKKKLDEALEKEVQALEETLWDE